MAARLSNEFWERAERLTALRYDEQEQMQDYLALESGHMEFLISALDGNPEMVQRPDLAPLPTTVTPAMAVQAVEFLNRTGVPIEPRKQWGPGQRIPVQQQSEIGLALCVWGDAGWSDLVRSGKYQHNRFADELVAASVHLIREWQTQSAPDWVTCIPSLRNPSLVQDFAERLSAGLGLPFRAALVKTEARPEQKSMANSTQQLRNVEGSLAVASAQLMHGPVLLVDDMVDSRWTFTVATSLLLERGCSAVYPFALADAGSGG